jgi:hypothetical protein
MTIGSAIIWLAIGVFVTLLALSAAASAGQCHSRQQCEAHGWMWRSGGRHHASREPLSVPKWIGNNPYYDPMWGDIDPNPHGDPSWGKRAAR